MQLSSLVTVVLRFFALVYFLRGIAMFISVAGAAASYPSEGSTYWNYGAPVFMVLVAAIVFIFSTPIARIVTPPPNPTVNIAGVTSYDLYCFAFTFLGLYFVLSSLGEMLNWLHYFFVLGSTLPEDDPQRQTSFYQLTQHLVTIFAGGASLLFAPRCARKLSHLQRKFE